MAVLEDIFFLFFSALFNVTRHACLLQLSSSCVDIDRTIQALQLPIIVWEEPVWHNTVSLNLKFSEKSLLEDIL